MKDANGNYIGIAYTPGHDQAIYQISDSLGRVITFNYDSSSRLTSLSQLVHPSGSKTYVTFTWGNPYPSGYSWYSFSGLAVNGFPSAAQMNVLLSCIYPNGTGYKFTYGDWGIVKRIDQLSSTGTSRSYLSYDYPLASAGALSDAPTYQNETISPDGSDANTSVWAYSTTKDGTTGAVTGMSITDPNGTVSNVSLDPGTGLTSSVQLKDSGGTALTTTGYSWTTVTSTQVTSTVLGGKTTTLNDSNQQFSVSYGYDVYGNTTDVFEYDFGGVLKRHTVTAYNTNSSYLSSGIRNLVTQEVVKDGSGNIVSRTDMAYDTTPLTSVTGASSHDDTYFGSGLTTRGNLASLTRYSSAGAGTGSFTRNFFYDTLGNVITAQLDCCNQKVFNFSSVTQYSAPDSIVRGPSSGPQYTSSYIYDPDNSLLLSATDENNQTNSYQYDSMSRVTQLILPPQNGTQVHVNTAYGDDTASPTVTTSNTANSYITVATLDGLGHIVQADTKNASTTVSSVKYSYDKLWRRTQESNPFAPSETAVYTTVAFDAQGRATQVTPPSAGYAQYHYYGNTVTVTDPAGKQRKSYSDALGRLIEVDEPGESFAGTAAGGTLTVSGTVQSQSGQGAHGAVSASAQVTITGAEHSKIIHTLPPSVYYDTGDFNITVNGRRYDYWYGQNDSPDSTASVAQGLVSAINADGGRTVNASLSGSTMTLTAVTAGTAGNTTSFTTGSTWDTSNWSTASFSANPASGNLSGGQDVYPGYTVYDAGSVSLTVGSYSATANYGNGSGLDGTSAAVASDLVGKIQAQLPGSNPPFSISVPSGGTSISVNWSTVGVAGNVTVTSSSNSTQSHYFSLPSFTICPPVTANPQNCTTALSGGKDAYSSGLANPFATTYTYDALGNVTFVSVAAGNVNGQPSSGQSRSSSYDSMGRLVSVTTPESGTVNTFYTDQSGNACSGDPALPCRVQDARAVVKAFAYDAVNRPTSIQYSDGTPGLSFTYDTGGAAAFALGRLAKLTEGSNTQTYTYDNFGRLTSVSQVIDGTTYNLSYGYNLASALTSITYPSGRVVTQNVDAIGRLSSIASGGTTYASSLTYNGAGQTIGVTLGNGVQGMFGYNDHMQVASLRYYITGASADLMNLGYDYGSNNNGQIHAVHYYTVPGTEDSTKSEYFNYDAWMRLSSANTGTVSSTSGSKTWSLQWAYDRFGNRRSQTLVAGDPSLPVGQPNLIIDPASNHIINSGYQYDAAGNLTNDGTNSYAYDGANRMKQVNGGAAAYTYFGALRIKKVTSSGTTVYIYSGTSPIAEYVGGTLNREYIYAGSQLLATVAGGTTTYHHPDHLSNRVETDASGNITRTYGNMPFGETWYETGTPDKRKFTSYENDAQAGETGLNYALFRYHSPGLGRFMSADLKGGTPVAPQSFNRYAYTMNDPVNLTDPAGLESTAFFATFFAGNCIVMGYFYPETWEDGTTTNVLLSGTSVCPPGDEHTGIDYGNTGGGGTDSSGPKCTLKIRVNNQNKLPKDQLAAIENQIANLFSPASVGVEFVDGGDQKVDATLNFEDAGWLARQLTDGKSFGITDKKGRDGDSSVFSGWIADKFKSRPQDVKNMIAGTVGAHELIHQLLQWGHDYYDASNPSNIMAVPGDNPNIFSDLVHNALKLTKKQLTRLLEDCLSRKNKP